VPDYVAECYRLEFLVGLRPPGGSRPEPIPSAARERATARAIAIYSRSPWLWRCGAVIRRPNPLMQPTSAEEVGRGLHPALPAATKDRRFSQVACR
jgi:hypothetical protein